MPMKIRISADSTCDLTSELIEQYDVKIAPLYILMDDRALRDGIECTVSYTHLTLPTILLV